MTWPDTTGTAPVWTLYGVLLAAALLMSVAFWAGRHRRPGAAQATPAAKTTTRGDVLAAVIATAVSAEGMWETFSALDMPVPLRALTFAFLELNVIQSGRRARRTMLKRLAEILAKGTASIERPSAGADGVAMWVLTCISAALSVAYELTIAHPNAAVVLVRMAAPLVAAWAWERSMALERRLQGWSSGVTSRFTWERIAVRLGIVEPRERTVTEVDTDRRLLRVAVATARLESVERHWHWWRAVRRAQDRKAKVMQEAMEHTDLATNPDTQARLLAITAAVTEARNFRATSFPFWVPQPAETDPRPRICSGKQAGPGRVALRMREPGKGMRVLHPAPTEARTENVERTEETRTSNRLMRRLQLRREAEQAMRHAVRGVQSEAVRARTEPRASESRMGLGPARTEQRTEPEPPARTAGRAPAAEPKATVIPLSPGMWNYGHGDPKLLVQPRRDRTGFSSLARTEEPPAEPVRPRAGKPHTVAAPARTARTDEVTVDVRKPRPHWVKVLADEIRTARAEGRTWEPDYDDLEARTGWKRSWNEKTVRAARTAAEEPSTPRTGTDNA